MYASIVYRPLMKPWKKIHILENNVAYVVKRTFSFEIMYRPDPIKLKTKHHKVFSYVKFIVEDDNYNRMNGRYR